MGKADNKLNGAAYLGSGDTFSYRKSNSVGLKDLDNLCRFNISNRSNFKMSLSRIRKEANIDVELYRLKSSFAEARRKIGATVFRELGSQDRRTHLQLVSASKKSGNKNETLQVALEQGEYVLRVLQRSGSSSYTMLATAEAIVSLPPRTPPTATFGGNLFDAKSSYYDFTITYSDDVAVNSASIDDNDILVIGPNGFSQLATRFAINDSSNGTPRIVTYRINAPNGSWDSSKNGLYNIKLQENQVSDTSGSFAAAGFIGNFFVNISQPSPDPLSLDPSLPNPPLPDQEEPKANLNATSPWKNNKAYTFTVTYTDNLAIDVASIDSNDILVTNLQGFSQLAEKISVDSNGNGNAYTATYRINAPNGGWTSTENGLYQITLQPYQVRDLSSNFAAAGALGSFSIQIDPSITRTPSDIFEIGGSPNGTSTSFRLDFSKQDEDSRLNYGLFRGAIPSGTLSGDNDSDQSIPWTDSQEISFFANNSISLNRVNGGPDYKPGDLISFKNSKNETEFRAVLFSEDGRALCIGLRDASSDNNLSNPPTLSPDSLSSLKAAMAVKQVVAAERFTGYQNDFLNNSQNLETVELTPAITFRLNVNYLFGQEQLDYVLEQNLDPTGSNSEPGLFGAIGNYLDNRITGNSANNSLEGLEGNDYLQGEGGDDDLYGDLGNDTLYGGAEGDELYGGWGNDSLYGGDGNDYLYGYGDYNATINDESQFDILVGGSGNDTFVLSNQQGAFYVESGDGYAIIQDWEPEVDRLQTYSITGVQYSVEYENVVGGAEKDTEIYYSNGSIRDRIAILQDIEDNPFE